MGKVAVAPDSSLRMQPLPTDVELTPSKGKQRLSSNVVLPVTPLSNPTGLSVAVPSDESPSDGLPTPLSPASKAEGDEQQVR
jgi:hypothetical protein